MKNMFIGLLIALALIAGACGPEESDRLETFEAGIVDAAFEEIPESDMALFCETVDVMGMDTLREFFVEEAQNNAAELGETGMDIALLEDLFVEGVEDRC